MIAAGKTDTATEASRGTPRGRYLPEKAASA